MTATTNPAARRAGALFDPSTFLESIDQDLAVFGELAALFLTTSVEQTAVLAAALDAGDLAGARDTAHGLKGSFALFATRPAIDVVARLEADCRTGATFDRRQRGAEVTAIVDAVRAELLDYCNARAIDLAAAPPEQPAP